MSFNDYLNHIRIREAEKLLISTTFSVTEIASSVGFCTTSYFIKQFKEHLQISPKQYRKNYLTKTVAPHPSAIYNRWERFLPFFRYDQLYTDWIPHISVLNPWLWSVILRFRSLRSSALSWQTSFHGESPPSTEWSWLWSATWLDTSAERDSISSLLFLQWNHPSKIRFRPVWNRDHRPL